MTMKLISYEFAFFDAPIEFSVLGYVKYNFRVKIEGRDEWYDTDVKQPFNRQPLHNDETGRPIWQWDGNKTNPTLSPSFLYDVGEAGKMHLFVRGGKLDILADTTIDCKEVKKL